MPPRPPRRDPRFNDYRIPPHRPPRFNMGANGLIALACLGVLALVSLLEYLIPVAIIAGGGYGIYRLATRSKRLTKQKNAERLQDLKDEIKLADRQIKQLDSYLEEKDYTQYSILAKQVLTKLDAIKKETLNLEDYMDSSISQRIFKKIKSTQDDITLQLERLDVPITPLTDSAENNTILKRAPELTTVYLNIQRDHAAILKKIETADNKAELTALHEADMDRFKDILTGYLKIKESPKDYYNAQERLDHAKEALDKFDLALDETLRKLNESDLKDFDVSIRMMSDDTNL